MSCCNSSGTNSCCKKIATVEYVEGVQEEIQGLITEQESNFNSSLSDLTQYIDKADEEIKEIINKTDEEIKEIIDNQTKEFDEKINNVSSVQTSTIVIGTSKSGHTSYDCDYLCSGSGDQTIINNAISILTSGGGGKIILLEGEYFTTGQLTIESAENICLEGFGKSTIINRQAFDTSVYKNGIRLISNCSGIIINNIHFKNCVDGITVSSCNDIKLTNVWLSNCYDEGVDISSSSNVRIENCYFEDMSTYGIILSSCTNSFINKNFIDKSEIGITGSCTGTIITNNIIRNSITRDVNLSGSNSLLTENILSNSYLIPNTGTWIANNNITYS